MVFASTIAVKSAKANAQTDAGPDIGTRALESENDFTIGGRD